VSKSSWWSAGEKPGDTVIPDNVRPQRGKKNTKRWCKGKPGVEHTVETVVHHASIHARPCHESKWMTDFWFCHHAIRCTTCGKYLKQFLPRAECPDWKAAQR
jgi:hypothetical protein